MGHESVAHSIESARLSSRGNTVNISTPRTTAPYPYIQNYYQGQGNDQCTVTSL